jgi:hypothetical protein
VPVPHPLPLSGQPPLRPPVSTGGPGPLPPVPDLPVVVVHGPAAAVVTVALWDAGLRPVTGTSGPTVWVPARGRS